VKINSPDFFRQYEATFLGFSAMEILSYQQKLTFFPNINSLLIGLRVTPALNNLHGATSASIQTNN
jgi:hypothetical protein